MSETRYTPGPLAWQEFGKGNWCLTGQYGMRPIVLSTSRKGELKLLKNGLLVPFTPEHPDAVLLAAGPELFKELQRLVSLMEPGETEGWLNIPGLATLNGARAALAKATATK